MSEYIDRRPGMVTFSAIMLFGLGGISLLAGISEFVDGTWVQDASILGRRLDTFWYGIIDVIIAIGAFFAAYSIFKGKYSGYWIGLVFATLSSVRWFMFMLGAPIWAFTMAIIWIAVVYGLVSNTAYFE